MRNGIDFEEAVKKAKKRNPRYNVCIEHPNAGAFEYDDGTDDVRIGSDKVLSKTSI